MTVQHMNVVKTYFSVQHLVTVQMAWLTVLAKDCQLFLTLTVCPSCPIAYNLGGIVWII